MSLKKNLKKLCYFKEVVTFLIAASLSSCTSLVSSELTIIENEKTIKSEIQKSFSNKIPEKDFELFNNSNLVLNAFQKLKENRFETAMKIAKDILFTRGLTPSQYKFAFKAYSISMILSINNNVNKYNILKNLNF